MNWYIAKMVFRIVVGKETHAAEFDEQLRLIKANDKQEAFQKASCIGMEEQECFLNIQGQSVKWVFVNVAEVNLLPAFTDGSEIYSQIRREEDPDSYELFVNEKAAQLIGATIPAET